MCPKSKHIKDSSLIRSNEVLKISSNIPEGPHVTTSNHDQQVSVLKTTVFCQLGPKLNKVQMYKILCQVFRRFLQ